MLVCKANTDALVELLQQQAVHAGAVHAEADSAQRDVASEASAAAPYIDRASRRLSSEHEELRAASARVVTLQWELGRCNAERQG